MTVIQWRKTAKFNATVILWQEPTPKGVYIVEAGARVQSERSPHPEGVIQSKPVKAMVATYARVFS